MDRLETFEPHYSFILWVTTNLPRNSINLLVMQRTLAHIFKMSSRIGKELLSGISSEVKEASCFAVIADETTDKSIKLQLNI